METEDPEFFRRSSSTEVVEKQSLGVVRTLKRFIGHSDD